MSINLGPEGCKAAAELQASPQFAAVVLSIKDQAQKAANAALDAPPEHLARQAGFARGLRDLYIALEAARTGTAPQRVKAPGVKE